MPAPPEFVVPDHEQNLCWRCGWAGHSEDECNNPLPIGAIPYFGPVGCFLCGQMGHTQWTDDPTTGRKCPSVVLPSMITAGLQQDLKACEQRMCRQRAIDVREAEMLHVLSCQDADLRDRRRGPDSIYFSDTETYKDPYYENPSADPAFRSSANAKIAMEGYESVLA